MTASEMAAMYDLMKRPARDGSLSEAIRNHAQACGFVAYQANVHPDVVAQAVAEQARGA